MDKDKIEPLKSRIPPKNIKQLQEFIGLCNYYKRFIENFAKIGHPLTNLLKKDTPFIWGEEQADSYKTLIEKLTSYPVLRQPDFNRTFIVICDASNCAIGAVLAQKDDHKKEYVCSFASRILKGAECHYGITEKECLAVIWAIKHFRVYLYGTRFTVVTDHSALTWLIKIKEPSGRLARWSIYLQAFQFDIVYRKGVSHANANALSRPALSIEIVEDKNDAYISCKYLDPYEDDNLIHYLKFKKHNAGLSVKQIKRIEKASKYFKLEIDNLGDSKLFFVADKHSKPLIVPKFEERDDLVKRAHLLGHFQTESTLKRLKEEYYWRNMKETVEKIVRSCVECCKHHVVPVVEHEAKVLEISSLFQRVGIDLTLGFPKTNEGYIGLLVITEYLSKYVMAYPIKSKMASEIAEKLFDYISFFGPPKEILSDHGTEFNNEIVHSLLKASGVEHRVTSAYHLPTNGMTERMNGVIVELINSFSDFSRDILTSEQDKIWNRSVEIRQLLILLIKKL